MLFCVLAGKMDSYVQLLTVLLIFVVVLGATALTTKWIAGYQKQMGHSGNIELLEAVRLGNNKYIQIVRVGETYVALVVCKDTANVLCEIPKEQLQSLENAGGKKGSFKEFLLLARMNGKGEKTESSPDTNSDESKDKEE